MIGMTVHNRDEGTLCMLYDIDNMPTKQAINQWIQWKSYFNEICPFCGASGWHSIEECIEGGQECPPQ